MYSLKPIVDLPGQSAHAEVMYQLPRIQGEDYTREGKYGSMNGVPINYKIDPIEYDILEHRQMEILYQLADLREQLDYLCVAIRCQDIIKPKNAAKVKPIEAELVLCANPAYPPYFILGLQRLWKDINIKVQIYRHSTAPNVDTTAFEEQLLRNANGDAVHNVDVKLIWKNVNTIQLLTKPYDYGLEGEATILRYLSRLLPSHNYESSKAPEDISTYDAVFDFCLRLPYEEPRNLPAVLSKLVGYFGSSSQWFVNSPACGIADLAVWSVVKRAASDKLPKELKKWFEACEKTFLGV